MNLIHIVFFLLCAACGCAELTQGKLQVGYYKKTCPNAENIVRSVLAEAMKNESRVAASTMRLAFHDCFVNGCDGSVLLDDTETRLGEKTGLSNVGSLRSFEVIDRVKAALERECKGIVSCADIIQLISRDAVVLTGGPSWAVPTGRLDSLTVNVSKANDILPSPNGSTAVSLIALFARFGLSVKQLVALTGAHTIGLGRCFSITSRLYDYNSTGKADPSMDCTYRRQMEKTCPKDGHDEDVVGFDDTPTVFDNVFFYNLVQRRGFLNSDEVLFTNRVTRRYVVLFAMHKKLFFDAFVEGMLVMGNLQSGEGGEIRKNCRKFNSDD